MTRCKTYRNRMAMDADLAEPALTILKETFGPHPPEAIAAVVEAIRDGIAWRASNKSLRVRGVSKFAPLLTQKQVDVPAQGEDRYRSERSSAHNWARYYGHTIATRWLKHEGIMRVYLLNRHPLARG